jgi:hypothetical protein
MQYPVIRVGPNASGNVLSAACTGASARGRQGQDCLRRPETTSTIVTKSTSNDGGHSACCSLVHVEKGANGAKTFVHCDVLKGQGPLRIGTVPRQGVWAARAISIPGHVSRCGRAVRQRTFRVPTALLRDAGWVYRQAGTT